MPELEAWEKVIITGTNGTQFLASVHGPDYTGDATEHPLSCQYCHGGAPDFSFETMDEAHADMIHDPSAPLTPPAKPACATCHTDEAWTSACDGCHLEIAAATANSLHTNLWGYQTAISDRCAIDFEDLPGGVLAAYQVNCAGCHTTCGQCHVSRPLSVGGGFPKPVSSYSHKFQRTPNMGEQCTACHGSRVGADFRGENGQTPDSHFLHGHQCTYCHDAEELHGDSRYTEIDASREHYEHRYEVKEIPRCLECHGTLPTADEDDAADVAHAHHAGLTGVDCGQCHHNGGTNCSNCHNDGIAFGFTYPLPVGQCQTCHSQPYKNCTNCHVTTTGDDVNSVESSAVQFKIARNASPYRPEYDFTVVRHVPTGPSTFSDWGLDLTAYSSKPTWLYTSPHNTKRVTPQTTVAAGQSCFAACHGAADAPSAYLLRDADLRDTGGAQLPDYQANVNLVYPNYIQSR